MQRRHRNAEQLGLFHHSEIAVPEWDAIPLTERQKLVELLSQLLRHASRSEGVTREQ